FRRADAPARAKSSIKIEPQRLLLLFRQTLSHDPMGSPQIILELSVREAGLGVMLDPFHAARGKIRCRTQARLFLKHLVSNIGDLEGDMGLGTIVPAAYGEHLAADLPHMRTAPLDHVSGRRQPSTECIILPVIHIRSHRRSGIRSEEAPASLDGRPRTDTFKPAPHMWQRLPAKLRLGRCCDRVAGDVCECENPAREEWSLSEPAIEMLIEGERTLLEPADGIAVSRRRIAAEDECLCVRRNHIGHKKEEPLKRAGSLNGT